MRQIFPSCPVGDDWSATRGRLEFQRESVRELINERTVSNLFVDDEWRCTHCADQRHALTSGPEQNANPPTGRSRAWVRCPVQRGRGVTFQRRLRNKIGSFPESSIVSGRSRRPRSRCSLRAARETWPRNRSRPSTVAALGKISPSGMPSPSRNVKVELISMGAVATECSNESTCSSVAAGLPVMTTLAPNSSSNSAGLITRRAGDVSAPGPRIPSSCSDRPPK